MPPVEEQDERPRARGAARRDDDRLDLDRLGEPGDATPGKRRTCPVTVRTGPGVPGVVREQGAGRWQRAVPLQAPGPAVRACGWTAEPPSRRRPEATTASCDQSTAGSVGDRGAELHGHRASVGGDARPCPRPSVTERRPRCGRRRSGCAWGRPRSGPRRPSVQPSGSPTGGRRRTAVRGGRRLIEHGGLCRPRRRQRDDHRCRSDQRHALDPSDAHHHVSPPSVPLRRYCAAPGSGPRGGTSVCQGSGGVGAPYAAGRVST